MYQTNTKYVINYLSLFTFNDYPTISPSSGAFPTLDTAQQLLSNPMVTGAAMQYGQGLVNMGQSYVDKIVSTSNYETFTVNAS